MRNRVSPPLGAVLVFVTAAYALLREAATTSAG
jgi:hypothetical protein